MAETGAPFYTDKMDLLYYLDENGKRQPIADSCTWERRREHILANVQEVMGPLPGKDRLVPLDVEVIGEERLERCTRRHISFASEPGDRVPAYLLLPHDLERPAPAMLCLHQTTAIGKGEPAGVGGKANLHYALELAGRGYVTLAPDYPNFGDYVFDPYENGYASATMKGIWNHMRAVDLLQSLPEVNRQRIGCIGHSLGGHNTIFLGAFDRRVRALVSSCGFNSFFKYYGGDLTGWSHKGYMPRIAGRYGKDPARMPFDFTELVAALAPRPFFVNAPTHDSNFEVGGVQDCVKAAKPVYELLNAGDNLVAVYPDAGHDFPPAVRQQAYAFLDNSLA